MLVYQTQSHRRLREESERALHETAVVREHPWSRLAGEIAFDCKQYQVWEAAHARLIAPAAQCRKVRPRMFALRKAAIGLVHQRGLISTIRENRITGDQRRRLFSLFYGPQDYSDAVLREHANFRLAVGSVLGAERLSLLDGDSYGQRLVHEYDRAYVDYFWAYARWALNNDSLLTDLLMVSMKRARHHATKIKNRLNSVEDREGGHPGGLALRA